MKKLIKNRLTIKRLDRDKRKLSISITSENYERILTEHISIKELKDFLKSLETDRIKKEVLK